MQINCPQCKNNVKVDSGSSFSDIFCDSCGSKFSLIDDSDETIAQLDTTQSLGRFQLLNEVGRGGFGSVWKGRDPSLDRIVAIKIPRKGNLSPSEAEKFFREARAVAQLKHPNIVSVHEIGKEGDQIYIVSDFVDGLTLSESMSIRPMSRKESARLGIQICDALAHAHEKGIVHRDLKPSNIMLDSERQPFLMDFGLAKRKTNEIAVTLEGQIIGTPTHMSPEQASGSGHDADHRSDIYSTGILLFQLLTGELPFRGNVRMLIHQVIHTEPPCVTKLDPNIDRDLATIVAKCLQKKREHRYQTAEALGSDLQNYLDGKPITARPVSTQERVYRWICRKPAFASALGVISLMISALAIGGPFVAIQQSKLKNVALQARETAQANESLAIRKSQEADAQRLKAQQESKKNAAMVAVITDAIESVNPAGNANPNMSAKDLLSKISGLVNASNLDSVSKASLLDSLSISFLSIGDFASAIQTSETSLSLRKTTANPNAERLVFTQNLLATSYLRSGKYDQALQLQQQTLELAESKLSEGHEELVKAMSNLGSGLAAVGRSEDSEKIRQRSLELAKKHLGEKNPTTLNATSNLARSYFETKQFQKALELRQVSLDRNKEILGSQHPNTIKSMIDLAISKAMTGNRSGAFDDFKLALQLSKKHLGPSHPETLSALNNLALSHLSLNQIAEATELLKQAVDSSRRILGEEHPETISVMNNLAIGQFKLGEFASAIESFRTALMLSSKSLGFQHARTVNTQNNLGLVFKRSIAHSKTLIETGKYPDAIKLLSTIEHSGFESMNGEVELLKLTAHLGIKNWSKVFDIQTPNFLTAAEPNEAWFNTVKSICFHELNQLEEAEILAERALNNPAISQSQKARANSVIALLLFEKGKINEATEKIELAFELINKASDSDDDFFTFYGQRIIARAIGMFEKANDKQAVSIWESRLKVQLQGNGKEEDSKDK